MKQRNFYLWNSLTWGGSSRNESSAKVWGWVSVFGKWHGFHSAFLAPFSRTGANLVLFVAFRGLGHALACWGLGESFRVRNAKHSVAGKGHAPASWTLKRASPPTLQRPRLLG